MVTRIVLGLPLFAAGYLAPPPLPATVPTIPERGAWSLTPSMPVLQPAAPQAGLALSLGHARRVSSHLGVDGTAWTGRFARAGGAVGVTRDGEIGGTTLAVRLGLGVTSAVRPEKRRLPALGATVHLEAARRFGVSKVTLIAGGGATGALAPVDFERISSSVGQSRWAEPRPVPLSQMLWGELDLRWEAIDDGDRTGFLGGVGIDVHAGFPVVPTVSGGLLFRLGRATPRRPP